MERSGKMTIEEVLAVEEMQVFDRKSVNIAPKVLAIPIIAFANADGGTVAIGISDKTRRIEGVDYDIQKLNELLRVPFDFCVPTVKVEIEKVQCIDFKGRENHVLLMHIEPSMEVHANQADEVFMRVGDKSKKLAFEERMQLMYDKGERFFEDKPVPETDIEDIDLAFVEKYIAQIGYSKTAMEYLRENKGFIKEKNGKVQISSAAILLFGKNPQLYFPRARVRFIRYEGTEERVGTQMNVIKDVIFEGNILKMITDAVAYLDTQIKEKTYLGEDGLFVTEEEYPKFVRQEIIVNAVTHRDYSIRGTDIQIKMFDDRIVVESPGKLPGLVKTDNIRHTHFSRNPKIAEFLKVYSFVKEYGEGVDRMCKELEAVGLQDPEYRLNAFMLQTTIRNSTLTDKKPRFGEENHGLVDKKPLFGEENHGLVDKKPRFGEENHGLVDKKPLFQVIDDAVCNKILTPTISENVKEIVEAFDMNQIFGRKEVKKELGYGDYKAGKAIEAMQVLNIAIPVEGKGKGKYILKEM
ncbi:ATP-binding protein [[Ruminococcus] lactaris]|nr:ATP-binding protein [[Ruminococcus] lactaris]MCB5444010.1 putative DNA binding domain-containing protein [[Ruminococcus] lactaris]MCB5534089.1 putative DNA binding domain-containing protein [[Ruminococcus] lactaris]